MVALSFVQVLQRQFLGTGLLWADTLLRHLVMWVGFLGAAIAAADGKHFAWEAIAHQGGRRGAMLRSAANFAGAAITLFLMNAAWRFFKEESAAGKALLTIGSFSVPVWLFALSIPTGFALVFFHSLLRAIAAATER